MMFAKWSKSKSPCVAWVTCIARSVGVALLLVLPALAQSSLPLPPPNLPTPSLKGPLGNIPTAPVPVDRNGNPIQAQTPTAAQLEAARKEELLRLERLRVDEERKEVETRRVADERLAAERLAEEQRFHNRIMTAVYVGLAIIAVLVISRLLRKRTSG